MTDLFRINTRISSHTNEWLDEKSALMGISKSALVNLALEHYIEQKEMMKKVSELSDLVAAVQRLEEKIDKERF